MANSIHIQLENYEVLDLKKVLLASQINLLKTIQKIRTYRLLRKQESALKTKLKIKLKSLSSSISHMDSELPAPDKRFLEDKREIKPESKEEKQKTLSIEQELAEIKKKLEMLS